MRNINVLTTLFNGNRDLALCPSLRINNTGPARMYSCSLNTAKSAAKISYAAVALEYIFSGRVSVLEAKEGSNIYAELWNNEKTQIVERMSYDGSNICRWENEEPANSSRIILPFVLFALAHNTGMQETKEAFVKCANDFNASGTILPEHLFYFCDCFYFEWKAQHPSELSIDKGMNLRYIQQTVKTSNAQIPMSFVEANVDELMPRISIEGFYIAPEPLVSTEKDKYTACMEGHYKLDYCWELEQTQYIPELSVLDEYIPCESFYTLIDLISTELNKVNDRLQKGAYGTDAIHTNFVNAILCGKPGTGKTTLAYALGAALGMPVRTVTNSKNTEEDNYQGMTKVAEEGSFKFFETPFLDVYKNGGIVILEEFNLSDPGMLMGALGQAIVKPFILAEDGYKEVKRHPMCVILSTMNTGTQGSREPSEAFTSRCPHVFILDDPTEVQFIETLCNEGYEKKDCVKVYKAYGKIISYLTSSENNAEDIALSITLRHCLAALRQMSIGAKFKSAIKNTMCGAIALKDLPMAKQVYKDVVEPMRGD